MKYKCLNCGCVFEDGEQYRWTETVGEYCGAPAYETMSGCPACQGDFEKMVSCAACDEGYFAEDLIGGVCKNCIDGARKDFDLCYRISFGEDEEIKINALLASLFEPSDIEQILIGYIKNKCEGVDCSAFIDADPYWFGERLAEEVRKNENAKG